MNRSDLWPPPEKHLRETRFTTEELIGHLIGPHGMGEQVKDAPWSDLMAFHRFDHLRGVPHAAY